MKIGILMCGHAAAEVMDTHGDYDAMFAELLSASGFEFQTWNVEGMDFPASVRDADGWLISGSRHGVYEDHPFIPPLEDFIRAAYAAGVPLVGICFGHQIIARALGGRVEKYQGGWAIGRRGYVVDGLGTVCLNAWHQDQVIEPPADARTFATNDFTRHAGLVYGDRAWSIQPHPEFTPALIGAYVSLRRGLPGYPDDVMDHAAAEVPNPIDSAAIADAITQFFKQPREARHG